MSDRYLCKAKRTDNGNWVEGYYVFIDGVHYIYTGKSRNGGLYVVAERFEVDPETLCQCTGLHDRTKWEELSEKEQQQFLSEWNYKENRKNQEEDWNGKKIWENDIVKTYEPYCTPLLNVVIFDEGAFRLEGVDEEINTACFGESETSECKVIGNIFDNPELLGGASDDPD